MPVLNPITGKFRPKKHITSLWLAAWPELHMYHCPDCRMPMFQYQGETVMEIPGTMPIATGALPVYIKCKNDKSNCERTVMIQAICTTIEVL